MKNNVKRMRIKSESKEAEDRLSELPEEIIIDIISLLPIRSAAATSVLSRRWRNLWTHIHSIDVRLSEFINTPVHARYNLNIIDDVVFKKLTSTSIERFTISGSFTNDNLDSWFSKICCRNVKEIKIDCDSRGVPPILPTLVFRTVSLVVLDIGEGGNFFLPSNWSVNLINLPKLKKLRLINYRRYIKFVEKLVSSCPLLEELFIKTVYLGPLRSNKVFKLSCHNLKTLELENYKDNSVQGHGVEIGVYTTKFVIDAPKLEYFSARAYRFEDLSFKFVGNPTALLHRTRLMRTYNIWNSLVWVNPSSNFFKTTSLELDCIRARPLRAFPNLTRLELRWPLDNDWGVLVRFLQYCPALEVLMLNIVSVYNVKNLRWIPSSRSSALETPNPPPCFLQMCLKKIELKIERRIRFKEQLINMVRYLLRNFRVLEQFTFRVDKQDDGRIKDKSHIQRDERKVCEDMFSLAKRSSRCQINFVGECHKASSNNARIVQES